MDIEFKEKTFEKYFGHELARITNVTFSPDQIDEGCFGFDEAFYVPIEYLVKISPYSRARRRHRLIQGIGIEDLDPIFGERVSILPKFNFNLIVQFKRPVFLKSPGAKQWGDWGQEYYRYAITPHQQRALEKIESISCGRAATVYASPAFWSSEKLFECAIAGEVLDNTNIAGVGRLAGHRNYSYVSAGKFGKAHSEAVDIENLPLREIISKGVESNEARSFDAHIVDVASILLKSLHGDDELAPIYNQVQRALFDWQLEPSSVLDAIRIMETFSDAFGLRMYSIG